MAHSKASRHPFIPGLPYDVRTTRKFDLPVLIIGLQNVKPVQKPLVRCRFASPEYILSILQRKTPCAFLGVRGLPGSMRVAPLPKLASLWQATASLHEKANPSRTGKSTPPFNIRPQVGRLYSFAIPSSASLVASAARGDPL